MTQLTPDLIARALIIAAELMQVDMAKVIRSLEQPKAANGTGRVRLLAAITLRAGGYGDGNSCAKATAVGKTWLAPTQLAKRKVTDELQAAALARLGSSAQPVKSVDHYRQRPGFIDPRRNLAREKAVVRLRKEGVGPAEISRLTGAPLSVVHRYLVRSGETFTPLPRGPKTGTTRKARVPKDPSAPRKARRPRPAPSPPPAPAPPPEAIEAFPDDHPTWGPLEGTTPCLLIHHEKGCRWPVTVQGSTGPMVCNQPKHGATPYCEPHAWLGASPAIRATMVRPSTALPAPRIARPLTDSELQTT